MNEMVEARQSRGGFVLAGVMMLVVVASLVGAAFLFSSRHTFKVIDKWRASDECMIGLQSCLEQFKYSLDEIFRADYNDTHSWDALDLIANLNYTTNVVWSNDLTSDPYVISSRIQVESGSVQKDIVNYEAELVITFIAEATYEGITRKVKEIVTYRYAAAPQVGGGDSTVFDYVFFIDNIGFFSGVNADFNGDVRANLDIDLQYSSIRLNGDSYAGGVNTSKHIYKNLNWTKYAEQPVADRARPAEFTDFNRSNPASYWDQGYDENVSFLDGQDIKDMPFVGPLDEYEAYAIAAGGWVSDSAKTVSAVWGDDAGEDAGIGTNDTGCLVLVGTASNPINIDGIVVATKDIYIKGYYTGQGTLYSGRNIHVVGDLIAVDPPRWPKPDYTPTATANSNKSKDFLGLCAKGSLIFGDYTTLDTSYLQAPHTDSHATDATDAALGYVTHYKGGIPYFNGDYTQQDANGTGYRTDGSIRRFFEPTLSDADLVAVIGGPVAQKVKTFDSVLYANHLISGEFDDDASVNGGFICRDEAVKRHGNLYMNWDIRLGSSSLDGQGFAPWLPGMLPRQTTVYQTVKWTELAP